MKNLVSNFAFNYINRYFFKNESTRIFFRNNSIKQILKVKKILLCGNI